MRLLQTALEDLYRGRSELQASEVDHGQEVLFVSVGLIVGFSTKELIAVSDVEKDPRFHKAMSRALGFKTDSILAVPIVHRGEAKGVIEVLNRKDGDHFTADEIEGLKLLARVAGSILNIFEQLGSRGAGTT